MRSLTPSRLLCPALLLATGALAHAQSVSIAGTVVNDFSDTAATSSLIPFTLAPEANTLVVLIASETVDSTPFHTVTFGDTVFQSIGINEGAQRASIFYAINPSTTSGNIEVAFESGTYAVSAFGLSNVASLGSSNSFGEPTSMSLNYTATEGGFVVAAFADNDFDNTTSMSIIGSNINNDATNDYLQLIPGTSSVSAGRALAASVVSVAGEGSEAFTEGANSSRNAGVVGAFVAVPEPGTAVLLLGGIGTLMGFRRSRQR